MPPCRRFSFFMMSEAVFLPSLQSGLSRVIPGTKTFTGIAFKATFSPKEFSRRNCLGVYFH